jgi:formate dehydrogenase subunit gamma
VAPAEPKPDESNAERMRSQPGNNAPMWRAVRESGSQPGLQQPARGRAGRADPAVRAVPGLAPDHAGEAWRQVRNQWIIPYGGSLLLIVVLALAPVLLAQRARWAATTSARHRPDHRALHAFRAGAHWTNAIAFVTLAISGIVMAFGKFFLLPVIGSACSAG